MRRAQPYLLALAACLAIACGRSTAATTTPMEPVADPTTTGAISGVVRDRASTEALSFATVNATPSDASDAAAKHTETTSAAGEFAIRGLAPGRYKVRIYYSNVTVMWQEVEVRAGSDIVLQIDIRLEDASPPAAATPPDADEPTDTGSAARSARGVIAGRVTDEKTGELLEGAVVSATAPHLGDAQLAVTDRAGTYRILGLPAGTYTVSVYYRLIDYGYIEVQRNNVDVAGGRTTTVPLELDTNVSATPH